jgi:hypothetical protein
MDILRPTGKGRSTPRWGRTIVAILLILFAWLLVPSGAVAHHRPGVALGAFIPHGDESPAAIDAFSRQVGWRPTVVASFKTFDQDPIYIPQLNSIREGGAIPMITWEPQTSTGEGIDLAHIARGSYDDYIASAARVAANWGKPLMVRFAEEMNGGWYPWSPAHGNSARSYVRAWRHVVRIFRREGADNVQWVWTPYVKGAGDMSFARFYPGDRYVDWAGVDGYNWGGRFPWKSFHALFASSYRQLTRLTSRPLMIGEVGCGEIGGNKPGWVRRMFRRVLPRMSRFRAVVWFDDTDPKGNLRVDSSTAALDSFRRWTNRPYYRVSRRQLLRTPERLLLDGRGSLTYGLTR